MDMSNVGVPTSDDSKRLRRGIAQVNSESVVHSGPSGRRLSDFGQVRGKGKFMWAKVLYSSVPMDQSLAAIFVVDLGFGEKAGQKALSVLC